MKQVKKIAAIAGLLLSPALLAPLSGAAQAETTFADAAVMKIVGHWEGNDNRDNGRVLKFFIRDGNASFEDFGRAGDQPYRNFQAGPEWSSVCLQLHKWKIPMHLQHFGERI